MGLMDSVWHYSRDCDHVTKQGQNIEMKQRITMLRG